MINYLIDTNHATKILAGVKQFKERLKKAKGSGDSFGISVTVLGELYFAAYASQKKEQNLSRLESFFDSVIFWDYDQSAAKRFGKLQAEQKEKGKPIPPSDAQIAAVALQNDLTVLTNDKHFTFIDNLNIENWYSKKD